MYRRPDRRQGIKARVLGAGVSVSVFAGAIVLAGSFDIGAANVPRRTLEFERFYIPATSAVPDAPEIDDVPESALILSVERATIQLDGIAGSGLAALLEESPMRRRSREQQAITAVSETVVPGTADQLTSPRPTRVQRNRVQRNIGFQRDADPKFGQVEAADAVVVDVRPRLAPVGIDAVDAIDARQERSITAATVIESGFVSAGDYNWTGFTGAFAPFLKSRQTALPSRITQLMGTSETDLSTVVRLEVDGLGHEMFVAMKGLQELHVAILHSDRVFYFVDSSFEGLPQLFREGEVFRTGDELTSILTEEMPVQSETLPHYYEIFLAWWEIERVKL